jgi:hypothetical protein
LPAKTTQAPPWLVKLLTPFIARNVAREMQQKYPGLGPAEIAEKMRAEIHSGLDPAQGRVFIDAVVSRLPKTAAPEITESKPVSAWVLVAANLIPLYAVLFWHWQVFPLLVLFWVENVIVGALNAVKLLAADPADRALWAGKLFIVPFFCFHYGMFTLVHGVFVFSLFGGKRYAAEGLWVDDMLALAARDFNLWLPIGALVASHLFSFFWNYLYRGEYRRASLPILMFSPYGRVVVLHVTILVGGFGAMALGSPLWALLLLLGLKIGIDLVAHLKEHRG